MGSGTAVMVDVGPQFTTNACGTDPLPRGNKMDMPKMRREVGKRLQQIRGNRDQRSFAENVDSVQQTISKYERGEIPRSWMFLARLHQEEGVDLNDLLSGALVQVDDGGNGRSANGHSGNGHPGNGRQREESRRPAYAAEGSRPAL
jgi:transcriptional regulator with XRE-family HTH domain